MFALLKQIAFWVEARRGNPAPMTAPTCARESRGCEDLRDNKDKGVVGGEKKSRRQQAGLSLPEHGASTACCYCTINHNKETHKEQMGSCESHVGNNDVEYDGDLVLDPHKVEQGQEIKADLENAAVFLGNAGLGGAFFWFGL
ncbi:hypothetical protein DFH29DRAFT_879203 [Suillus ampliporus]|nr:hypothetical protein DFH29DRAFT_879203 [Suillus ampliporus]